MDGIVKLDDHPGEVSHGTKPLYEPGLGLYTNCDAMVLLLLAVEQRLKGGVKSLTGGIAAGGDGQAACSLFLCREWSGSFGSRKVGRGLATKLHPHLIALG